MWKRRNQGIMCLFVILIFISLVTANFEHLDVKESYYQTKTCQEQITSKQPDLFIQWASRPSTQNGSTRVIYLYF